MTTTTTEELIVLLDDRGREIGTAEKISAHHRDTPLHLGFSCYVFDAAGRVLITRRALEKVTWPGVWTNSFCGHPLPDESVEDAVRRRAARELGIGLRDLVCVLPDFRYRAVAADGTVENEVCPVFSARTDDVVRAAADEAMDSRWIPWDELSAAAQTDWALSPWAVDQIPLLEAAGLPLPAL